MSVIEDSRKILQDFLAPELRAITARLDSMDKRFDGIDKRFDGIDKRLDRTDAKLEKLEARFDKVDEKLADADRKADRRHNESMSVVAQMIEITMLRDRVARLESGSDSHQ